MDCYDNDLDCAFRALRFNLYALLDVYMYCEFDWVILKHEL